MFGLFSLALASLLALVHDFPRTAVGASLLGFAAMIVLDPVAALDGQAPLFFARLRPPQLAVAVTGLAAVMTNIWLFAPG